MAFNTFSLLCFYNRCFSIYWMSSSPRPWILEFTLSSLLHLQWRCSASGQLGWLGLSLSWFVVRKGTKSHLPTLELVLNTYFLLTSLNRGWSCWHVGKSDPSPTLSFFLNPLPRICLLILEREEGSEREREKLWCKKETSISCPLYTPLLGIKPAT